MKKLTLTTIIFSLLIGCAANRDLNKTLNKNYAARDLNCSLRDIHTIKTDEGDVYTNKNFIDIIYNKIISKHPEYNDVNNKTSKEKIIETHAKEFNKQHRNASDNIIELWEIKNFNKSYIH